MESEVLKVFLCIILVSLSCVSHSQEIADYVLVEKSKHLLTLFKNGKSIATYHVVFGGNPVGHKEQEGDQKTPEGRYTLDSKNSNSTFTKAIHISYPNAADIAKAKSKGVSPGGVVMIHGQKNGFGWASFATQRINWTKGCVALSNEDMEKVWKSINVPTQIEIKP
jgi:murein L,D-transpeptidase YafK